MTRERRTADGVGQIRRCRDGSPIRLSASALRALSRALRAALAGEPPFGSATAGPVELGVRLDQEGRPRPPEEGQAGLSLPAQAALGAAKRVSDRIPVDQGTDPADHQLRLVQLVHASSRDAPGTAPAGPSLVPYPGLLRGKPGLGEFHPARGAVIRMCARPRRWSRRAARPSW